VQRRLFIPLLLATTIFAAAACQSDDADGGEPGRLRIAASTALIAEFATIVAGDNAEVSELIPAGVDVHSYEPAPATVGAIAAADLVLVNGYNLEEGLLDVILENVSGGVAVVPLAAGLTPFEDESDHKHAGSAADGDIVHAEGDPHFWLDVANAIHYVEVIRDRLIDLDEAHADGYRDRATVYLDELRLLDADVRAVVSAVPEVDRQLVVMHDAYRYLAAAYGLDLVATLLPAGAQQDPSAGAIADLIELIEVREVAAIYREPQFSSSILEAVASETDVAVLLLYSTFTEDVASYVEMMRVNADALVEGLRR